MALRLLPFRQYNETDVINLYQVAVTGTNSMDDPSVNGGNDNGVLVKVSAGNWDGTPTTYETQSYLGKTDYPFIGRDQYPVVGLQVNEASSGEAGLLGVTLRQTLTHDENGEKLLYYPQKAIELQAVLTGQAVPILTKGVITVDGPTAFENQPTSVGQKVYVGSPANGKAGLFDVGLEQEAAGHIGVVIATGNRVNRGVSTDQFAGASVGTGSPNNVGAYYVIKLDVR